MFGTQLILLNSGTRLCRSACRALIWGVPFLLAVASLSASAQQEQQEVSVTETASADLHAEDLAEQCTLTRANLVAVRRAAYLRRQQFEATDESARVLVQDMHELRRQLRDKKKQLEALAAADEEWADLHQQESDLFEELQRVTALNNEAAQDQDLSESEENFHE